MRDMPIYEYECEKCGHRFELWRTLSQDTKKARCPKDGAACKKVISLSNFHLKGGGWAKDGYSG